MSRKHKGWSRVVTALAAAVAVGVLWGAAAAGGAAELWVDGPAEVQPGVGRENPDATVNGQSRSIFVWNATSEPGGDSEDIFLRRFDRDGNPLADPAFVNTYRTDAQVYPRVAVAGDGSFLVVWQSQELDADAGVNRGWVRSQAFDTGGAPVGGEQLLSTLGSGLAGDIDADVAALRGGGYVVVWRSLRSTGSDGSYNVQARLLSASGVPLGPQFQVNTTLGQAERNPAVTELADGGFLVVWATPELHARRFTAAGVGVGDDFQVNTLTTGTELEPDVAVGWDGRVLVVWKDGEDAGDGFEIRARLYSADLEAVGDDFRVNTLVTGDQDNPKVADYGPDGFFVVWESVTTEGTDPDPSSIQARVVTGGDQFAGPQAQLNEWTTGDQGMPGAGGSYGHVVLTWRSASNSLTTSVVITAQRWETCLFCDDLEWGSTGRWSVTVP